MFNSLLNDDNILFLWEWRYISTLFRTNVADGNGVYVVLKEKHFRENVWEDEVWW